MLDERARHESRDAAGRRARALRKDGGAAQGAGRRLRRPLSGAAQPSRARAPHRGARLLSQVRRRAPAHDLPIHRAHRRARDRRRLRMARPHRAAGLPADVIDCIGSARTATLPQPYALAHAILEKTMAWQIVPDDLQVQAVTQWGKRGLVEIVVLSGFYQMFAAINQGFDIRPAKSG